MTEKSQPDTHLKNKSLFSNHQQICRPLTLADANHAARLYTEVFLAGLEQGIFLMVRDLEPSEPVSPIRSRR